MVPRPPILLARLRQPPHRHPLRLDLQPLHLCPHLLSGIQHRPPLPLGRQQNHRHPMETILRPIHPHLRAHHRRRRQNLPKNRPQQIRRLLPNPLPHHSQRQPPPRHRPRHHRLHRRLPPQPQANGPSSPQQNRTTMKTPATTTTDYTGDFSAGRKLMAHRRRNKTEQP